MHKACSCPVPTYIANIGTITCPVSVGQVQKMIFWRAGNKITDVATMIVEATWTTLLSATDATHAVVTPYISNPTFEPGAQITYGSGNEVRDGVPINVGTEPTKFTCRGLEWPAANHRAIKELACESLEVIFINEEGKFVHRLDGTEVKGFPIQQFFASDRAIGGFQSPDMVNIEFYLKDGWSDYITLTDPSANFEALALTD